MVQNRALLGPEVRVCRILFALVFNLFLILVKCLSAQCFNFFLRARLVAPFMSTGRTLSTVDVRGKPKVMSTFLITLAPKGVLSIIATCSMVNCLEGTIVVLALQLHGMLLSLAIHLCPAEVLEQISCRSACDSVQFVRAALKNAALGKASLALTAAIFHETCFATAFVACFSSDRPTRGSKKQQECL